MDRQILHVDMNGFYASVEMIFHPEARNVPMAVGGDAQARHGVILAKNELAKQRGVKTAETIWQARKKCPELLLLPPHHDLYHQYYEKANAIYRRFTDQVEPASIDESYLDVTGSQVLFGTGEEIAHRIRQAVKEELQLTVSVGVSFCKTFAKIGSDLKKPDAVTCIPREKVPEILWPLSIEQMLSVGAVTAARLRQKGIGTIGDLARQSRETLEEMMGKHGASLYLAVHGLEEDPVRRWGEGEDPKSIGRNRTFRQDVVGDEAVRRELLALCEDVAWRLRRQGMRCWGVQVTIKDPQFVTIDRQGKLDEPENAMTPLFQAAWQVYQRSWKGNKPIRMLGVTAIRLTREAGQMSLFDDGKKEKLSQSIDGIWDKFGPGAIRPAALLKKED